MRRKFIKNTGLTVGALPFMKYLNQMPQVQSGQIDLSIFATNWGFQGTTAEFCEKAKNAGYDGIELWAPMKDDQAAELMEAVDKYELKLCFLAGNWGKTFDDQFASYKAMVDQAIRLKPHFINSHSGKDFYSLDQNSAFLEYSFEQSAKSGIPIYHETHRGRMLYAAPVTRALMERYPQLKLTLDISHWCCVHESLLADQPEVVDMAIRRTDHVHARVGFAEGPQIPRPDDPKHETAVKAHFAWWDRVVEGKAARNEPLTMTAEFGPAGYMWTQPFTGEVLADNWEVNVMMKDLWDERYRQG